MRDEHDHRGPQLATVRGWARMKDGSTMDHERDDERRGDDVPRLELGQDGVILDHSAAAAHFLGFDGDALCGEHVSRIFPQLAAGGLVSEGRVSPRLAFLCRCGFPLEGVCADGGRMAVDVSPYVLRNGGPARVMLAWPSPPAAEEPRDAATAGDALADQPRARQSARQDAQPNVLSRSPSKGRNEGKTRLRERTETRVL